MNLLLELTLPFDPVPASRPRVSRWGTYYGKRHKAYQQNVLEYLNEIILLEEPTEDELVVSMNFYCKKPKTSKYAVPIADIDNLIKLPLDCITTCGRVWVDDRQVTELHAFKNYCEDRFDPRTDIFVWSKL